MNGREGERKGSNDGDKLGDGGREKVLAERGRTYTFIASNCSFLGITSSMYGARSG